MVRWLAAAILLGTIGCKARQPGRVEQVVAAEVKRHITVGGRDTPNPVAPTPEAVVDGQAAFLANCSACHGTDGRNTGVPFARTMSPPVPELTSRGVQAYSDGQLHAIIADGLSPSGMPAWREFLTDGDMWRLVLYIRHLASTTQLEDRSEDQPAGATVAGAASSP